METGKSPLFEVRRMDVEAEKSLDGFKQADEATRVKVSDEKDENLPFYFEKSSLDDHNKMAKKVNVEVVSTPETNKSNRSMWLHADVKNDSDDEEKRSSNFQKSNTKPQIGKNTPVYVYTYKVTDAPFCFFID